MPDKALLSIGVEIRIAEVTFVDIKNNFCELFSNDKIYFEKVIFATGFSSHKTKIAQRC